MNDKVILVVFLVIGIVVLSNLAMFALVRGSRGLKFDWFKGTKNTFSQPFGAQNESMNELHERVEKLSERSSPGE